MGPPCQHLQSPLLAQYMFNTLLIGRLANVYREVPVASAGETCNKTASSNFRLIHEHEDWIANEVVYDFGMYTEGTIILEAIKHSDKTIEVKIRGPFPNDIIFREPIPHCDAGTMSIQRLLQRVNGAFTFFPPKTPRSRRTIAMPVPVAAALHQHMKHQLSERMVMGEAWEGDAWGALVFTDQVGRPLAGFHVSRRFRKLLQLAGLPPMRYHDLRHGPLPLWPPKGCQQGWRWRFWATPKSARP